MKHREIWADGPPPFGHRRYWQLQGDTSVYQGPGLKMWATIGDWELHDFKRHLGLEEPIQGPARIDPRNDPAYCKPRARPSTTVIATAEAPDPEPTG